MGLVTKNHTFSAGAVIIASEHNDNFDTLFNLINGNIDDANIKTGAAISAAKLNLATIAQAVNITGNFLLGASVQGDIIYDNGTTFTRLSKNSTATRYLSNTGTTNNPAWDQINIINGLKIASQAQGDIIYADSDTTFARLAAGTAGKLLKTQGAGANPTWVSAPMAEAFSASGTFTAPTGVTKVFLTMVGGGAGGSGNNGAIAGSGGGGAEGVRRLGYNVTPLSAYTVTIGAGGAGGNGNAVGSAGGSTIFNDGGTKPITVLGGQPGATQATASATSGLSSPNTAGGTGGNGGGSAGGGGVMSVVGGASGAGGNGAAAGGGGGSILGVGGTGGNGGNPGAADGYGSGGGGSDGGTNVGGSGTGGYCLVEWYV